LIPPSARAVWNLSTHPFGQSHYPELEQLTPQPKTVIRTSGDHIGTDRDRQRLLEEAMTATRHWLISEGAVSANEP